MENSKKRNSSIQSALSSSRKTDLTLKVSIIIPVFNKVEYTEKCLSALAENTSEELYEVIIVDNSSTDGTKDFLKYLNGYVKVISNTNNVGFAKSCNQGAKIADGKYLLFLNNDTVPQKDWLGSMVETAEREPKVGIVGSKLLYPNGRIQHAGIVFYGRTGAIFHIYKGFESDHPRVNYARDYNAVTGACLLILKELFWNLGGFYEGFIAGYEDVDLCLRTKEKGYRVIYQPKSQLIHFEEVTRKGFPSRGIEDGQLLSKRNSLPDDVEEKAREDGYAIRYLEGGQIEYLSLKALGTEKGVKANSARVNEGSIGAEITSREESQEVPRKEGLNKIAIVRGPNLNKWEMQNYEPLCETFDVTAYATTAHNFDISKIEIPMIQLQSKAENPAYMEGLEEHLADKDIVYTADITWGFSLQAIKAKEKYGNRVICLEWENTPFAYEDHEMIRTIKGRVIDGADHFIAVTERAKRALILEGVPEGKIDVIPMGVDVKRFAPRRKDVSKERKKLGIDEEDILVLFIGRLVWEKGVYDLIHAAKLVLGDPSVDRLPIRFLIVGKGPELKGLRDRVIKLGMSGHFEFLIKFPYQKMHSLHNLADIFVLPSISTRNWQEQYGMVLVESMACGKPVISTLSGSIPEVVGTAGILVQPNDPLSLSKALRSLIMDQDRRDDLGRRARKRAVNKFDSAKVADRVGTVFKKVLARYTAKEGFRSIYGQGLDLWNQGKREEGFQKIHDAFEKNPQDRGFLEALVRMAFDLNRAEIGERCLKEHLKFYPANIEALLLLANNLIHQGKFGEAQEEIGKVTIFDPENREALDLMKQISSVS